MTIGSDPPAGGDALGSEAPIGEQGRYGTCECIAVGHGLGRTGDCQIACHSGAIAYVGPVHHGAVQSGRLERVVAALGNQGSADEGDPGKTVEQPEFAHRVGKIEIGLVRDRLTMGPAGGAQAVGS